MFVIPAIRVIFKVHIITSVVHTSSTPATTTTTNVSIKSGYSDTFQGQSGRLLLASPKLSGAAPSPEPLSRIGSP